jgi:uncharacterized protein
VALASDATLIEPDRPELTRIEVFLPRLPEKLDGFTIAQLSDFHYDPYFSIHPIKAAVEITNTLNPDLAVLTGDFVTLPILGESHQRWRPSIAQAAPCADLLRGIRARHGLVAVLGNHDQFSDPDRVAAVLEAAGIRVLRNQSIPVEWEGSRFWLAGVNDVTGGTANLNETLRRVPTKEAAVLLCHEPDFADTAAHYPVDLQLSGHSHGGQVRFPFIGPLYLPDLARKYPWGLRKIGPLTLYTNCGIGTIRVPVRLNCPPEVTLVTLRSGAGRGGPSTEQNKRLNVPAARASEEVIKLWCSRVRSAYS